MPFKLLNQMEAHETEPGRCIHRPGHRPKRPFALETVPAGREIVITGRLEWDPLSFTIRIPQEEFRKRLKEGESIEDMAEELVWDTDYSETESDPYYRNLVIEGVKGE